MLRSRRLSRSPFPLGASIAPRALSRMEPGQHDMEEVSMLRFGMAAVAVSLIPALLAALTDTSRMRGSDTTRGRSGRQQQRSAGSVGRTHGGMRLNHDQVTQLQTALQQNGCDPGAIDGVMGAHTRSAMRCARQKNNITSNNPGALYQSLNLNFSASDTGAVGRSSTGADS